MNRAPLVLAAFLAAATALTACGGSDAPADDVADDATGAAGRRRRRQEAGDAASGDAAAPVDLGVDEIRLDWATYNPASLVLKEQGWLEEAVGDDVTVTWEFSAGSAPANELLRGDVVDFNSTAGAAALLARANGSPLRTVDVLARPSGAPSSSVPTPTSPRPRTSRARASPPCPGPTRTSSSCRPSTAPGSPWTT